MYHVFTLSYANYIVQYLLVIVIVVREVTVTSDKLEFCCKMPIAHNYFIIPKVIQSILALTLVKRSLVTNSLLPVRSMREGYAFVSVCVRTYMCVCVSSKNTPVCVLPLETLHENTLQLLH